MGRHNYMPFSNGLFYYTSYTNSSGGNTDAIARYVSFAQVTWCISVCNATLKKCTTVGRCLELFCCAHEAACRWSGGGPIHSAAEWSASTDWSGRSQAADNTRRSESSAWIKRTLARCV